MLTSGLYSSDYRPMPTLDRYDSDVLDDEDYDTMSQADRVAAEQAMQRRDQVTGVHRDDRDLVFGH